MNDVELSLLKEIADIDGTSSLTGAYNIRKNGKGVERKITENINIVSKEDVSGIDIFIKENTKKEFVHILALYLFVINYLTNLYLILTNSKRVY